MHRIVLVVALAVTSILAAVPVTAQPIGVFRWQLAPYCNVVSLAITQSGTVYRLDGTDDRCGATRQASATGDAFLNPDGTIGFGFTLLGSSGALPVHVTASVTLPALNGTWRDDAGNAGAFVFTPGAGTSGSPRPSATKEIALSVHQALSLGNTVLNTAGCRALDVAGNSNLLLGLDLPMGAIISQVRVKLVDQSAAGAMGIFLVANNHLEGGSRSSVFASEELVSSNSSFTTVPLVLTLEGAVPVSDARTYHIEATTGAHTGTLSFCGATVRYTLP